jgi:hypothetical protein
MRYRLGHVATFSMAACLCLLRTRLRGARCLQAVEAIMSPLP